MTVSFPRWTGIPSISPSNIERDIRALLNVKDLAQFQLFVKMCASRTGQLLNLSALAADCGITHNTAKAWIGVLETSGIVYVMRPYYRNYGKRLVKSPKLHFLDPGLVCHPVGNPRPGTAFS
jgi:predicted AAA+ superfamily ATPase